MKKESNIKSKWLNNQVITVAVVAILIIAAVILVMNGSKNNAGQEIAKPADSPVSVDSSESSIPASTPETPGQNTEQVKILSHTMEIDKAYDRHKIISGRVQNNMDTRAISVEIIAQLYDSKGNSLGKLTSRPLFNDLDPKQISPFNINIYEDNLVAYNLSVIWK